MCCCNTIFLDKYNGGITMRIDFHSHVKISKKSQFMPSYFEEMMREAKESGLEAIAMTEHFNTERFYDVYDYLDAHHLYEHGYYLIDGLKVFPGIEVDVKEIGHILLIGDRSDILEIRNILGDHTHPETFISFRQLLDLADDYELLKIGAHAFRESTPLYQHDPNQLKRLDALDLNGKDLYTYGVDEYGQKMEAFAYELDLPIVAGSDTHQFLQYGCVYNDFTKDCQTVLELKQEIQEGNYKISISPDIHLKVKSAKLVKKMMKKLLNEYGVIESIA